MSKTSLVKNLKMQHQFLVKIILKTLLNSTHILSKSLYWPRNLMKETLFICFNLNSSAAFSLNTIKAQEVGIYSHIEHNHFWNRVLFAKSSWSTLKLIRKSNKFNFFSKQDVTKDASDIDKPYKTIANGFTWLYVESGSTLHTWLVCDAIINLLGYFRFLFSPNKD